MKASKIAATVFGVGLFPAAQGTIMSAIAVPLALLILLHGGAVSVACASLIVFTIGIFASDEYMRESGRSDPPECVIDELAGQWLACAFAGLDRAAGAPVPLPGMALAFLLFRLFDIWKPWPISWFETVPGGWGVMLDDMAAGLVAGALVLAAHYFHLV